MIIEAKDLKWYIENTISDNTYKIRYYFNDENFADLTVMFKNGNELINLRQVITDFDAQTVNVYINKVLPVITLEEVIKECNNHNALCEGCPFYKNDACAFYIVFPCSWKTAAEECGYKLEV